MGWEKVVGGGERVGCIMSIMILNTVFQFNIFPFFLHPVHIYQINDTIRWEWKLVCVCERKLVCVSGRGGVWGLINDREKGLVFKTSF